MKKLLIILTIILLGANMAYSVVTEHTNKVNLVLADVCDGTFNDFSFKMSGYDDQKFVFAYDQTLSGVAASFRITKPIEGTIYLDVPVTSVTVSGTNITFSIARTNIPPPGNYYGEVLTYEAATTNYYRSVAQGKLPVTWSLYLNETNYFQRSTTNAGVGQVYVHPNWIDPPWLGTNAGLGAIYVTLVTYNAYTAAQLSTNAGFQTLFNAQVNTNSGFQSVFNAQANTNSDFQVLHTAQANTNSEFQTLHNAQSTTNAAFETRIVNGETAYGWGDWSGQGFLTGSTNLFTQLTVGNRAILGANLSGLTQGTYTGVLTSVAYTGVTVMALGRTYAMGFTKANAFGTSTLSIASQSLLKTTAGAISNYFVYSGTDTNLILRLDGDGSSKSDVTGVYVKQITNGNIAAAWDINVGHNLTINGAVFDGDNYVATNNSTYTATVAKAASALQTESDPVHTNWLATNTYVQSNTGNWAGTWQTYQPSYFRDWANTTNRSVDILGYGITDAWTKIESDARFGTTGSVAAIEVDLANHKTNINVHLIAAVSGLTTSLASKATTQDMVQAQSDIATLQTGKVDYVNATYTATVALAASAVQTESDPVWVAVTGLYARIGLSGGWTNLSEYNNDIDYATGTPVYAESDPVYGASVAAGILAADTNRWNTGATDASTATNNIATINAARGATNITAGAADSYSLATRTLTWNTNAAGGAGSGFPLTEDGNLAGYSLSNGSFVGNGAGLTNILNYVPTNDPNYLAIETNAIALHDGTNINLRESGTNIYFDYTATNPVAGTTAGTYYDGANGHSVSGQVAILNTNTFPLQSGLNISNRVVILETNTAPLQSYLSTSNDVAVIKTNYYGLQQGIAASNLAYTANTNAEAARVIATNAQAVANAALPKSETNALSVTTLQITGVPTTNAMSSVWGCTNAATGQGNLNVLPKISAENSSAYVKLAGWQTISFPTLINQVAGVWDGTNWTPGVVGQIRLSAFGRMLTATDGGAITKNGILILYNPISSAAWNVDKILYNDAVTNKYAIQVYSGTIVTNDSQGGVQPNIFSAGVEP